jgi:hypothetical protein
VAFLFLQSQFLSLSILEDLSPRFSFPSIPSSYSSLAQLGGRSLKVCDNLGGGERGRAEEREKRERWEKEEEE